MTTFENIENRLDDPSFRDIIRSAVYPPTETKIDAVCDKYRSLPTWSVIGALREGRLVGFVGVEMVTSKQGVIQHIGVAQDHRRAGIGRSLIDEVLGRYALESIEAETDSDAVDFYRHCGFDVASLGDEKYPGTERFHCSLTVRV